ELVERDAMLLVEHSRMATLLGLVHRLPARRLVDRPRLQIAIAWAHCLTHHPEGVHRALACVEDYLQRHVDDTVTNEDLFVEAQLVRGTNEAYADHMTSIEALVQPSLEDAEKRRPWIVSVAANVLSYRFIYSAQFEQARALQAWARKFHERTTGPFSGVYGLCLSAMAAIRQCDLDAAAAFLREALDLAGSGTGRHSHAARLAAALWGQIQYERNELPEAERLLEESRALGAEGGVVDFSTATYVTLVRLRAEAGDAAKAHELLDEGLGTAHRLGFERLTAALDAERVRLYLRAGDIWRAQQTVDAKAPGGEARSAEMLAQVHEYRALSQARIKYARGDFAAAVASLRKLVADAHADERRMTEVTLQLPLARALDGLGDQTAARTVLAAVVEVGARQGLVRSFLDEDLLPLLVHLRDSVRHGTTATLSNAATHHLDCLIAAGAGDKSHAESTRISVTKDSRLVEPLTERELQIARMLTDGCSNKEIADKLGIAVNTVKWYLKGLYSKLSVRRRTQAVAEVKRLGLIE
ncbi:MAG: winged helix-turn-helix transcriptional regulator, partial [Nevskiaceae bacterium]